MLTTCKIILKAPDDATCLKSLQEHYQQIGPEFPNQPDNLSMDFNSASSVGLNTTLLKYRINLDEIDTKTSIQSLSVNIYPAFLLIRLGYSQSLNYLFRIGAQKSCYANETEDLSIYRTTSEYPKNLIFKLGTMHSLPHLVLYSVKNNLPGARACLDVMLQQQVDFSVAYVETPAYFHVYDNPEIIELLIDNGLDINHPVRIKQPKLIEAANSNTTFDGTLISRPIISALDDINIFSELVKRTDIDLNCSAQFQHRNNRLGEYEYKYSLLELLFRKHNNNHPVFCALITALLDNPSFNPNLLNHKWQHFLHYLLENESDAQAANILRIFATCQRVIWNVKDRSGKTLVHQVVANRKNSCLQALLDIGALPDLPDFDKITPLRFAVKSANYNAIQILLNSDNIDIEQPCTAEDDTALIWAAKASRIAIAKKLVSLGANSMPRTNNI